VYSLLQEILLFQKVDMLLIKLFLFPLTYQLDLEVDLGMLAQKSFSLGHALAIAFSQAAFNTTC